MKDNPALSLLSISRPLWKLEILFKTLMLEGQTFTLKTFPPQPDIANLTFKIKMKEINFWSNHSRVIALTGESAAVTNFIFLAIIVTYHLNMILNSLMEMLILIFLLQFCSSVKEKD